MSFKELISGKPKHDHKWGFMRTELSDSGETSWFYCTDCLEQAKTIYSDKTGAIEMFFYAKKPLVHLAGIPDKKK